MATLTAQEFGLVDSEYKKYHSSTTGFNYDSPSSKVAQETIDHIVKMLYSANEEPLPKVGDTLYEIESGNEFTVRQEDLDAYCASKPQVCATGQERAKIIKVLMSGGTMTPGTSSPPEPTPEPAPPQPSGPPPMPADPPADGGEPVAPVEDDKFLGPIKAKKPKPGNSSELNKIAKNMGLLGSPKTDSQKQEGVQPEFEDNPCDPEDACKDSDDADKADAPTETDVKADLEAQGRDEVYTYDTPVIDTYKKLFVDMVPDKIYFVDVSNFDIDAFKKLQEKKQTSAGKKEIPKADKEGAKAEGGKAEKEKDCPENPDENAVTNPNDLAQELELIGDDVEPLPEGKTKKETDAAMDDAAGGDPLPEASDPYARGFQGFVSESHIKNETDKPSPTHGERVNYFYFGDLIDNVLQGKLFNKLEKDQTRLVFGPVTYENHWLGNKTTINLADVPISLNLFVRWFYYTIWKTARTSYTLREFLYDCVHHLLVPALGAHCTEGAKQYKIDMQTISVPGVRYGEHKGHRVPLGRVELADIHEHQMARQRYTRTENLFHYIFIYVIDNKRGVPRWTGDRLKDHANGLYWLEMGADVGLLKRAKFKKNKNTGATEAMTFSQTQNIKAGKDNMESIEKVKALMIWSMYHVDLEMIGNSIFMPGQHLYLDVTSLGLGKPGFRPNPDKGDDPFDMSAAAVLGIGGYYQVLKSINVISADGWKTDLQCFYQGAPSEPVEEEAPIVQDEDSDSGLGGRNDPGTTDPGKRPV